MSKDLFEIASREKYRFGSIKGDLTVEMLWDLPLTSRSGADLDSVAKGVNAVLKESAEESFVKVETATNTRYNNMLEIVKYIIGVKLKERQDTEDMLAKKAEREKLLGILERKQNASLEELSVEELQAKLNELG